MNIKVILTFVVLGLILTGCALFNKSAEIDESRVTRLSPNVKEGEELYCFCDDEDKARDIAKDYNIEFVKYDEGIATFHAQGDLNKIIKDGKEAGFKELSLNILKELK